MAPTQTAACPECQSIIDYDPDYVDDPFDATEGMCVNCAVKGFAGFRGVFGIGPSVEEGMHDLTFLTEGAETNLTLSTAAVECVAAVLKSYLESDSEE